MNRTSLRLLAGAVLAGVAATTLVAPAAQAAPEPAAFCSDGTQPMVPKAETEAFDDSTTVRGLTVVKGTTPVEFTGTFVGAIDNALGTSEGGTDMLLFSLRGAGIDRASTATDGTPAGIWAGMSGSPVYLPDGRLIGAVAYGLSPDNVPIAGITPAYAMKRLGADKLRAPAKLTIKRSALQGASARTAATLAGQSARQLKAVRVVSGGAAANDLANRTLARVPAVSASARSARAGGFGAVAAPSGLDQPLVPGGNIAVGYTTGDLFAGGVGTVTAICGSTVWAFGHPLDFAGPTSLSIHNASAALVMPDSTGLIGSYKQVGKVGQQIGTITTDGYAGIKGQVGLIRGFPVVTHVRNARGAALATYRGTVVDPAMAAFGAGYGPAFAVQDVLDNLGIGTAKLSWRIDYRLSNGRTGSLSNSQIYADAGGELADVVASDIAGDVSAIASTDLADVTVTGVSSTMTLISNAAIDHRFASAQRWTGKKWVTLRGSSVKAGRTMKVRPVYRQYVNGRPKGTSAGPAKAFKIGKNAKGRASVTFSARAGAGGDEGEDECIKLDDGQVICPDFDSEGGGARTFEDLVAGLDGLVRADRADVAAQWKWKLRKSKGVSQRRAGVVAPGRISGSYAATFRVRR
ncbi:hypothetical protein [Aeromicrobium duanguangcaii]|uniref:Peptidase S55 domain-containing protein n=1 Tax=Aeromicrobium duanguangcaii TaxID=2968086 RepID=A0ABY5KDA4_9ACTN|nr:hypothetical protein [Aeromicrobium duanguangcaii]MCD9155429.1 hypothetical protein [Aeromicrobium duanguangcaii]UUI68300.1 hypothetical protein NP095_13985 [Aeromicrobium duanguangcaii]